jgi:hypothetical protein
LLATYKRTLQGTLQVRIQVERDAERWVVIATRQFDMAQIADNSFLNITFEPPLQVPAARGLAVELTSDVPPGEGLTWWTYPAWAYANYQLLVNGQPQKGGAIIAVHYDRPSGRFVKMLPRLWSRTTVFLDPLWQGVLLVAILVALGSLAYSQLHRPG